MCRASVRCHGGGLRLDVVGAINRRDTCVIQVDLADVDFIDSSAIGAFISGYKGAQANGATLTITDAHGQVRKSSTSPAC